MVPVRATAMMPSVTGVHTAKLENVESAAQISRVVSGDYQFALFGHLVSPEPDQNHYFWTSANAPGTGGININFSQYKSDTVDAAFEARP